MNTDQPHQTEKILISKAEKQGGETAKAPPTLARRWRAPRLRLTLVGGILAIASLGLVFFMPKLLKKLLMTAFWNTPYGGSGFSVLLSQLSSLILWDEDHSYFLSSLLGIISGWLVFICSAQALEFVGVPIYQENERT